MLGIVRFDQQEQELVLERTAAFISGGLADARQFLTDAVKQFRDTSIALGVIAAVFFGCSGLLYYNYRQQCKKAEELR